LKLALALVHYPILDREKKVVATNITNFDIHDIARACTVFGVSDYFIVHPMQEQQMFVHRVLDHWRVGQGAKFNPYRRTALEPVKTASDIKEVVSELLEKWNEKPIIIATHARSVNDVPSISCAEAKDLVKSNKSVLLVFGTGFGLTDDFMVNCDYLLESIRGAPPKDYRHLSVRSAVSIYLDRIVGPC